MQKKRGTKKEGCFRLDPQLAAVDVVLKLGSSIVFGGYTPCGLGEMLSIAL